MRDKQEVVEYACVQNCGSQLNFTLESPESVIKIQIARLQSTNN